MRARFAAITVVTGLLLASCADTNQPHQAGPSVLADSPVTAPPTSPTTPNPTTPTPTAPRASEPSSCQRNAETALATPEIGRTDVLVSGNRRAPGSIDLLSAPVVVIDLPTSATWIVPHFDDPDSCQPRWYVTLDDDRSLGVDPTGIIGETGAAIAPPESIGGSVRSALVDLKQFDNPLPDSRVARFGPWRAALVDPTDRYGHAVLGDRIEAGAVEIVNDTTGEQTRIVIEAPTVIEGISPMLIDVDGGNDATPELLVTLSNDDVGAWLALYDIDGSLRAESPPIGQGFRWRNQLGAGSTGPAGEFEIVDVRTPHLDGTVEFFRVVGDRLQRTASITGYTNHTLGSRNLDLGILVDADGDKVDEVVLPTRDLRSIAVIDRVADGAVELGRVELDGALTTNIASQWIDGQAWLALGVSSGRVMIFGTHTTGLAD